MRVGDCVKLAFVGVLGTVGLLVGCSSKDVKSGPVIPSPIVADRCAKVEAPSVNLVPQASDEPNLTIPKPVGWDFSTRENNARIRGIVSDEKLTAQDFIPNFAVSLDDVTEDSSTANQALDIEVAGLAQVAAIDSDTAGMLCGYPSRILMYEHESRSAATLIVAGKGVNNKVWIAKVDTQTTEPDNPDYVAAKKVIFGGFQFILPNDRA